MKKTLHTKVMNYGKRPLWQWISIYIVIGGIIYAAIYFLFLRGGGNGGSGGYKIPGY